MFSDKINGEPYTVWDHMAMHEARKEANKSIDTKFRDKAIKQFNGKNKIQKIIDRIFGN